MDNIHKLIEAAIKYLENHSTLSTQEAFSLTEVIALAAALLSLVGLVFTTIYTVRKNTRLQNANARVEWIQKVRNVTAELISTYYSALNEDDVTELQKTIIKAREQVELLILYFGPEKSATNAKIDLMNPNTNDGKNDLILDFLVNLSNDFVKYYKNSQSGILTRVGARLDRASTELQNNVIGIAFQEEVEVDGKCYTNTEYNFTSDAGQNYEQAQKEVDAIKAFNGDLDLKLINLRNIMRIYLKIEWNKAKQGK
jgi:hypothetical protein